LDLVVLGQLLGSKRRPEIMPLRLPQHGQHLSLCLGRQLAIRGTAPQAMHHHGVTLIGHAPE